MLHNLENATSAKHIFLVENRGKSDVLIKMPVEVKVKNNFA